MPYVVVCTWTAAIRNEWMNVTILVMKDAVLSVKKQLNIHLVNVNVLSETGILEYIVLF